MFNKLKHLKDLRSQAKQIQDTLSQETITVEKNNIVVNMNGNMEITSISINEELAKESMEKILADTVNEAIKKAQKMMAQKMQQMGGLDNFKLQ